MYNYFTLVSANFAKCVFVFVFISLSIDPLQGQRPHGYRNSQVP